MVTFTNISGNYDFGDDDIRQFIPYLEPNPKKEKDKYIDPINGGHNLSINPKTGKWNTWDEPTKEHRKEVYKFLAETYGPKNYNTNYSVSVLPKQINQVKESQKISEGIEVLKKSRTGRPQKLTTLHFPHDVLSSEFKVYHIVEYFNHQKKNSCVKAINNQTGIDCTLTKAGIDTKDILPYYDLGYEYLVNEVKPEQILIVEGQYTAQVCFEKFDGLLPTISVFGGANKNRIPVLINHLNLNTALETVVLSPDFDWKGLDYMVTLSKELTKAGYKIRWLFPYGDSYWHKINSLPVGHESVDLFDLIHNFPALTGQQIVSQTKDVSIDTLENLLTAKTDAIPGVIDFNDINLDDWIEDVREKILETQSSDNYLVEGLFNQGQSVLIGAKAGVGKSTMMTQLSVSITLGLDFMGKRIKQGKVLYNTSDENIAITIDRLVQQGILENEDDFYSNFILLNRDKKTGKVWTVKDLEVLRKSFEIHKPKVFILDSLTTGIANPTGIDVNKPEIANAIELIINLCREYNVTFFLLHHLRKDDFSNDDCYSGSHQIPARFDSTWKLERVSGKDNARVFKSTKDRYRPTTTYFLEIGENRSFNITDTSEEEILNAIPTAYEETNPTEKEQLIVNSLIDSPKSVREIAKKTGLIERTIYRHLAKLIDKNDIVKINDIDTGTNRKVTKYHVTDIDTDIPPHVNDNVSDMGNPSNINVSSPDIVTDINIVNDNVRKLDEGEKTEVTDIDSVEINGTTFKVGDYYYQNRTKSNVLKIAYFTSDKDGDWAKCYLCKIDKETNIIISTGTDATYELCLNNEVFPHIEG